MICRICKKDKQLDCFGNNIRKVTGKNSFCKVCKKGIDKISYEKRRSKILIQKKNKKVYFTEEYNNFKSSLGCVKCGETKHYMLDFHHLEDENKEFNIGVKAWRVLNMQQLKNEIDKCIVICSNEHREFHFLERTLGITIKEYLKNY